MAVEYKEGWYTEWTNSYPTLTEEQKNQNALTATDALANAGWTLEAIGGWLGNVFTEGLGNPGQWEIGYPIADTSSYSGRGLVGWTPWWRLSDWLTAHGYSTDSPYGQMEKILEEASNPDSEPGYVFWVTSFEGVTNYFNTYEEYTKGTLTPEEMARWFCYGYERPGVLNLESRMEGARKYYEYIKENYHPFVPRTSISEPTAMEGNKYFYDSAYNTFYPDYAPGGSGIPGSAGNCTWYAYGRFGEINEFEAYENHLPTGNGEDWFPANELTENYEYGQEPKLGAVICFSGGGDGGHVAIVERIEDNGDVYCSNSAYGSPGTYFYMETYSKANGYIFGSFTFQGFIYSPKTFTGGAGSQPFDPLPNLKIPIGAKLDILKGLKKIRRRCIIND